MAIILLIRHGENDMVGKKLAGRLPNVHLNETGKVQARRLGDELASIAIKAVLSSPLERAMETAEPIAHLQGLPIEPLPELLEIDFGGWEGKRLKVLKRRRLWKMVQSKPSTFRFPDGETFEEAQKRVSDGLLALNEKFSENDIIVCVTHSDLIRLAVAHFLGLPLDNFQRLRIDTASLTVLFLHNGQAHLGSINHTFDFPKTIQ